MHYAYVCTIYACIHSSIHSFIHYSLFLFLFPSVPAHHSTSTISIPYRFLSPPNQPHFLPSMRHIKSHIRTQIKITFTRSSPHLIPIIFRIPIQRLVSIFQIGIHLPFDACPRTAVREVYFSAAVGAAEHDLFLPVAEGDELGWRWVGGLAGEFCLGGVGGGVFVD